jgi:hypothetical protein
MVRLALTLTVSAFLIGLGSAQTPRGGPASPSVQRINVTCANCSSKASAELKIISKGIVETEATACFTKFFGDNPPTEVNTRVATAPKVDICGTDHVIVTPKTPQQALDESLNAKRDLIVHFKFTGNACAWEGDANNGVFSVRTGSLTHKCWASFTQAEKGGIIVHELTHKLGYKHCTNEKNEDSNTTVPYTVKHAVEACWVKQDEQ